MCYNIQDFTKSLEYAEESILKDPQWVKGHFRKAQALRALGKRQEAIDAYKRVLILHPNNELAKEEMKELLLQK